MAGGGKLFLRETILFIWADEVSVTGRSISLHYIRLIKERLLPYNFLFLVKPYLACNEAFLW